MNCKDIIKEYFNCMNKIPKENEKDNKCKTEFFKTIKCLEKKLIIINE